VVMEEQVEAGDSAEYEADWAPDLALGGSVGTAPREAPLVTKALRVQQVSDALVCKHVQFMFWLLLRRLIRHGCC